MKTSMFMQYVNFEWYDGKKHSIPKDGSWATFAYYPVVVLSSSGRSVMPPAARPTPTYSPAPTPRASTPQKGAMGFTSSNLVFAETEFLSPVKSIATPAICLESPSKWTSKTFNVRLDVDQLDLLSQDAENSDLSTHGLYLYMCTYSSAADATTGIPKRPISVEYPVKLSVYVNAKAVSVADVQKSIVCGQPLNLTEHIYKTTDHPNNISITYSTSGRWVSSLVLAKELSLQAISSEIRKTSFVTAENVRQYFFKASTDSDDDDLISTGALISLKCPLGLCRIKTPTRSKYCQHSQCFDCETFLQIKRRTNTWKCPVCSGAIKSWRELIVDGYFEEILQGTAENDDQVYIESNGDWKKKETANTPKGNGGKGTPSSAKGRALDVDVIDDSAASDSDDLLMQGMHRNKRRRTEVIDLTLDSDSDACNVESDDLPPLSQEEIEMVNSIESAIRTSTQASSRMGQSGQNSRPASSSDQLAGTVTSTPTNNAPTRGSSSVLAVRTAVPGRWMTQTPTRPHRRSQNGRGFPQSASAAIRRLRPSRHSAPIPRVSSSTLTLPITAPVSTSASVSAVPQASEAGSTVAPRPPPTQSNSGSRLADVVPNSSRSNPSPVNAEASTPTLPEPNLSTVASTRAFSDAQGPAGTPPPRLNKPDIRSIPRPRDPIKLATPPGGEQFIKYSPEFLAQGYDKHEIYVHPGFITDEEHDLLAKNCEKKLRRLASTYEMGHFDKRIHNYRECSVGAWLPNMRSVAGRVALETGRAVDPDPVDLPDRRPSSGSSSSSRSGGWTTVGRDDGEIRAVLDRVWGLFPSSLAWLPPHILDLHQDGEILPHVDNPEYSGFVVGGLTLLGPAVSTFKHVDDPHVRVDVLLEPRSLYFMTDRIRYQFTHEITVGAGQRVWQGVPVPRARRISLMFRDAKQPEKGWSSLAVQ
ncbi:E3 SUMO-protein ligase pli1 [Coemansia sp. RSA 1804]|nr:E3 SUMO-protein ligase pli1 [Coemansia sp. RSA 1804]